MKTVRILYIFTLIVWGVVTSCYLILLWVDNESVDQGEKLLQIQQTEKSLKTENQLLENEIASRSSLLYLGAKSKELGFTTPKFLWFPK